MKPSSYLEHSDNEFEHRVNPAYEKPDEIHEYEAPGSSRLLLDFHSDKDPAYNIWQYLVGSEWMPVLHWLSRDYGEPREDRYSLAHLFNAVRETKFKQMITAALEKPKSLEPKKLKDLKFVYPDYVRLFIEEAGLPNDTVNMLDQVLQRIDKYLKTQNLEYELKPDLFVDPEYPDWQEVKLSILIKKDLAFIYDQIKTPVYEIVRESVPSELLNKILIKFETLSKE